MGAHPPNVALGFDVGKISGSRLPSFSLILVLMCGAVD